MKSTKIVGYVNPIAKINKSKNPHSYKRKTFQKLFNILNEIGFITKSNEFYFQGDDHYRGTMVCFNAITKSRLAHF